MFSLPNSLHTETLLPPDVAVSSYHPSQLRRYTYQISSLLLPLPLLRPPPLPLPLPRIYASRTGTLHLACKPSRSRRAREPTTHTAAVTLTPLTTYYSITLLYSYLLPPHVDSPSPSWLTQLCRLPTRLQRFCRMAVAHRRFPVNL